MSAHVMRELLLRVQVDANFAERVRVDPDAATAEYDLTDRERETLRGSDWSLHAFLVPRHRLPADRVELEAEPNMVFLQGQPPPDNQLPPLTVPDVTLPEPMSNLHHPLVAPPDEVSPPPTQTPPTENPPTDPPVGPFPPPDEWESGGNQWGRRQVDVAAQQALIEEIQSTTGELRRAKLTALLEGLNL
ncbi:hypothetical protein GCM10023322_65540 [Rugosimonospora acidiphila]|uniref:Uncharacterized protein n=1 Tax=Rugosimonospora acidiphila TaxID=556531 RepID=A0ABP9SHK5_9ACTN